MNQLHARIEHIVAALVTADSEEHKSTIIALVNLCLRAEAQVAIICKTIVLPLDYKQQLLTESSTPDERVLAQKMLNPKFVQAYIEQLTKCFEEIEPGELSSVCLGRNKLELLVGLCTEMVSYPEDHVGGHPNSAADFELSQFMVQTELQPEHKMKKQIDKLNGYYESSLSAFAKSKTVSSSIGQKLLMPMSALGYLLNEKGRRRRLDLFYSRPDARLVKEFLNYMESGLAKHLLDLIIPGIRLNDIIKIEAKEHIELEAVAQFIRDDRWNNGSRLQLCHPREAPPLELYVISDKLGRGEQPVTNVILHVHGGGFIGLNPKIHMTYSCKWAKSAPCVIVSVNYRKAPEWPYPAAMNDVLSAYLWLLEKGHQKYGYRPDNVIVVGDSAGGNLVLGLSLLCVKLGLRVPDSIVSFYPATNLALHSFIPSRTLAFEDTILNYNFLKLCVQSYVTKLADPLNDFCLSPNVAHLELLSKLPPVHIEVGSRDPLRDDGLTMGLRLKRAGVKVNLQLYSGACHGYLNFQNLAKFARLAVQKSIGLIQSLCR